MNAPIAATFRIQDRAEDRSAIKSRPAKPIDRATLRDQRHRTSVTNDRVVLDCRRLCAHVPQQLSLRKTLPAGRWPLLNSFGTKRSGKFADALYQLRSIGY